MSESASERPEQLRIRSMQDIFDALRSPEPRARFSILQAIIQNPEKAAAYGTSDGADLVDELCDHARNLPASPLRTLVLGALVAYKDPRVREIFLMEMHVSGNAETLILASRYLAGEAEDDVKLSISGLLFQNNSIDRARAAANIMAGHGQLSDRERIRIALLSSEGFPAPGLSEETGADWSAELQGPYASHARRLLEAQAETAFLYLRKKWDHLEEENRTWLLEWGADKFPVYIIELILRALDSGSDLLVPAALEAIITLKEYGKIFAIRTGRYLQSKNPAVRLAAVRAGAPIGDWKAALSSENDTAVRIAMLTRLAKEQGAAAAPTLIRLIEEGDYRLRAAATSALQNVSKDVVELMKPLMKHSRQAVQVAAAQVLIAAGEELWLEEQLLA